jgi:hypothetical protein
VSWHTFGQILALWTLASVTVIGGPAVCYLLVDLVGARRERKQQGGGGEIDQHADWVGIPDHFDQHPAHQDHQPDRHLVVIDGGAGGAGVGGGER